MELLPTSIARRKQTGFSSLEQLELQTIFVKLFPTSVALMQTGGVSMEVEQASEGDSSEQLPLPAEASPRNPKPETLNTKHKTPNPKT